MELAMRAHGSDGRAVDVVTTADDRHTVGELADAIAPLLRIDPAACPTITHLRRAVTLDRDRALADGELLAGDDIVVGAPVAVAPANTLPVRAMTVDVIAGADAATSTVLLPGRYVVGRGPAADLSLDDPTVSRRHAVVEIADDRTVTLTPCGDVENQVRRDGIAITDTTGIDPDDVIELGAVRVMIRPFARDPLPVGRSAADREPDRGTRLGHVDVHRTPYHRPRITARRLDPVGRPPSPPEPRRLRILAALAPTAGGLSMFAFSGGNPRFLLMVLVSPLVMLANWLDDRKHGRRRHADEVAAFRRVLLRRRDEVAAALAAERAERLAAAPDLAALARRAELRAANLWERSRDVDDFLVLRLGLGTVPSLVTVEPGPAGDEPFAADAAAANDGVETVRGAPVTIDLAVAPVVGIHGPPRACTALAASMAAQAACLHSPDDLVIAAVLAPSGDTVRWLDWVKWLPHTRTPMSPLGGDHLAVTADAARRLLTALAELADARRSASSASAAAITGRAPGTGPDPSCWPKVLLLLDLRVGVNPVQVADVLDRAAGGGLRVLLLADRAATIPRQATAIVELTGGDVAGTGRLRSPGSHPESLCFGPELLHPVIADRLARTLAPLRDASSGSPATAIPRHAALLDVLGVGSPTAEWVLANWGRSTGAELSVPLGEGVDGPVVVDFVADGPHALVGGTSGAGKSELLQSLVAGLAARHSPAQLTFLFVDYKGGASAAPFAELVHTVGCVSNLTPELARRALVSLRAELDHRMRTLDGRAGDLQELRRVAPELAPPALMIVVDEFATLVKEIPEFVAGVVDIAQRGRSLGIHLVLATQRPTGAIDDNVLANTNLRIALRMLSAAESSAVIGTPDAAAIPVPLRGRAYLRCGPQPPIAVQCAFTGARLTSADERRPVRVAPFTCGTERRGATQPADERAGGRPDDADHDAPTHLSAVLTAIGDAVDAAGLPPPRRPWRDELPATIPLAAVLADATSAPARVEPGRVVALGMVDVPERQAQHCALVDLEAGGGLLIFGTGGAGKSTALRTIAASISQCAFAERPTAPLPTSGARPAPGVRRDARPPHRPPRLPPPVPPVEIVVFDFGARELDDLAAWPTVTAVVPGDDLEAITRTLTVLGDELARRRRLRADATTDGLLRRPRIVVLVDDIGGLAAAFAGSGSSAPAGIGVTVPPDAWPGKLVDLAVEGRQLGIHVVITADRRAAVPTRLHSAIANRIVLRHADVAGYGEHGIGAARAAGLDLGPGRGLLDGTTTVQIARSAPPTGGDGTVDAVATPSTASRERHRAGTSAGERRRATTVASAPLPDDLPAAALSAPTTAGHRAVVLGVADVSGAPVTVDLQWSDLLVGGAPRSGRSSVLALVAGQLARADTVWTLAGPSSPLAAATVDRRCHPRADTLAFLDELCAALDGARPPVLVVDDLDGVDDPGLGAAWTRLAKHHAARIVAAVETSALTGYAAHPMLQHLRRARRQLLLCPDDGAEVFGAFGVRAPLRPGVRMTAGRGVLLVDRLATVIQTARWDGGDRPTTPRP